MPPRETKNQHKFLDHRLVTTKLILSCVALGIVLWALRVGRNDPFTAAHHHLHPVPLEAALASLINLLFLTAYHRCMQDSGMGSSSSKQEWQPSAEGTSTRKISKSGYDITPMTAEERKKAAASLTDFQRYENKMLFIDVPIQKQVDN